MSKFYSILFQDESILVINKPAGVLTIPDGYDQFLPNLQTILKQDFEAAWTVHRLDKDTSGVMIFARSLQVHHILNDQFEHRLVKKTYHALVAGLPTWDDYFCEEPLRVNGDRRHRTVVAPMTGKPASTHFHVASRFSNTALIEAFPHTGYTHQIRAHLLSIGFPILSDPLYAPSDSPAHPKNCSLISRTALHAFQIKFQHPSTGEDISFQAPHPDDFQIALKLMN